MAILLSYAIKMVTLSTDFPQTVHEYLKPYFGGWTEHGRVHGIIEYVIIAEIRYNRSTRILLAGDEIKVFLSICSENVRSITHL